MNKLVILSGKAQSGKDTGVEYLIDVLQNRSESHYKRYSFATPLKEFLHRVFGIPKENLWGTDEQKNALTQVKWNNLPLHIDDINRIKEDLGAVGDYMTARHLMMVFGSDICRQMYYDCWVNATYFDIEKDNTSFSFIADARFPNEISYFLTKPLDTLVIRLSRNLFNKKHASETSLDDFDFPANCNYYAAVDNAKVSLLEKNSLLNHVFYCFNMLTQENNKENFSEISSYFGTIRAVPSLREHILTTPMFFRHNDGIYVFDAKEVYDNGIGGELNRSKVYRWQIE